MKTIIEESKTVQNFTILLYSRTFQTLYLQIYDIETKDLFTKLSINTSDNVDVHLGRPLKQLHIMVKKNQQNCQILNEFKFTDQDFSINSTVQELQNYIKLKKTFPQYSLLFQIFYRLPSFNSAAQLTRLSSTKSIIQSDEKRKKQYLNQIKKIASANLFLLQYKIVSQYQKYIKRQKVPNSRDEDQKMVDVRGRKTKKCTTFNAKLHRDKKNGMKKNNCESFQQNNSLRFESQKQFSMKKCESQEQKSSKSIVDRNLQIIGPLFKRKTTKTKTYEQVDKDLNVSLRKKKKITFFDQRPSNQNLKQYKTPQKSNLITNSIIRQQTNQSVNSNIQKYQKNTENGPKCSNFDYNQNEDQNSKLKDNVFKRFQNQDTTSIQRQVPIKTYQPYKYNVLQQLCYERPSQRVRTIKKQLADFQKRKLSNQKRTIKSKDKIQLQKVQFENMKIEQKNNKSTVQSSIEKHQKSLKALNKYSKEKFYQQLYLKTVKSIERQSKVIDYVRTHCQTQILSTISRINKQNLVQNKTIHNVLFTSEITKQQKLFKLKKRKAQQQYISNLLCKPKIRCSSGKQNLNFKHRNIRAI